MTDNNSWPTRVTSDGSLLPWTPFDWPVPPKRQRVEHFVPVITEADIDTYLAAGGPTNEGNPRDGFDDTPRSMAMMLRFLGWVAQLKAMDAPQSDPGHFGYETMLYEYHRVADEIASLW